MLGKLSECHTVNEIRSLTILIITVKTSVDRNREIRDAERTLSLCISDFGIPGQATHKYDFIHDDLFFLFIRPLPVLRTDI
jgi:hypothetical protein